MTPRCRSSCFSRNRRGGQRAQPASLLQFTRKILCFATKPCGDGGAFLCILVRMCSNRQFNPFMPPSMSRKPASRPIQFP